MFECLSLSTSSFFPCHLPSLSSETKSLSSLMTVKILKGIHHLKGTLHNSVLFNLSLIHRRDSMHVQAHGYTLLLILNGLLHLCTDIVLASFTQFPWGSRHIMLDTNTAG